MEGVVSTRKNYGILGMMLLASVVLASGSAFYDYLSLRSTLTRNFHDVGDATVNRLAVSLKEPLWNMDKKLAQELVKLEMAQEMIHGVEVKGADNKTIFVAFTRGSQWEPVESKEGISGESIQKEMEIARDGKKLGYVKTFITSRFMEKSLRASLFSVGIKSLAVALCLVILLHFLIKAFLVKPISRVISGLSDAGNQVASASLQVASSSRELAEGTSEQAACIEETSSSLEEMASMTRQNADNANQANQLMSGTKETVSSCQPFHGNAHRFDGGNNTGQ